MFQDRWLLLYFSESGFAFVDLDRTAPPATVADVRHLLARNGLVVA
ncbi:hypothetical protein [Hymenobacter coalescens]